MTNIKQKKSISNSSVGFFIEFPLIKNKVYTELLVIRGVANFKLKFYNKLDKKFGKIASKSHITYKAWMLYFDNPKRGIPEKKRKLLAPILEEILADTFFEQKLFLKSKHKETDNILKIYHEKH